MSLVIDLDPVVEERLRREAGRSGVDPGEYVGRLVEEHFSKCGGAAQPRWATLTPEEWVREYKAYCASHRRTGPPLSDYAVSREGIYEGRY